MTTYHKTCLIMLLAVAISGLRMTAAEDQADVPLRMANGAVIEGTAREATPEGLVIQGGKGQYTAPWKLLSAGVRYRYEIPMLAAQEAARIKALKKAQAEAAQKEAAEKAAAAKKAAAAQKAATNATGVVSNPPPAK